MRAVQKNSTVQRGTILIASQNAHKIEEIAPLLAAHGFVVTDARTHALPEPEETGRTFLANAHLKAQAALAATGMIVLADDSGIIVEALGDFPGVDSKPHADACGGYPQAIAKIFDRLQGRDAACFYATVMVLLFPDGREFVGTGKVHGRLILEPRGRQGFGHDPWFHLFEQDKTMAELTLDEKNAISHRGRALQNLLGKLP